MSIIRIASIRVPTFLPVRGAIPREAKCVSDLRATGAIEIACRVSTDERIVRVNVLEAMFLEN